MQSLEVTDASILYIGKKWHILSLVIIIPVRDLGLLYIFGEHLLNIAAKLHQVTSVTVQQCINSYRDRGRGIMRNAEGDEGGS